MGGCNAELCAIMSRSLIRAQSIAMNVSPISQRLVQQEEYEEHGPMGVMDLAHTLSFGDPCQGCSGKGVKIR
jgi:hypothetical protein